MSALWSRRLLRWLTTATVVSAGTGVLLSVPPLSLFIYPVYSQVYVWHGWVSLVVAGPFTLAALLHGIPAWRVAGFAFPVKTGLALTGAFWLALASGLHTMQTENTTPWVLFVHVLAGIAALVTAFLHAPRLLARRRSAGRPSR